MKRISKIEPMKENIIAAYTEYQQPLNRIAATYGSSIGTVRKKLKDWGVTLRSRGRPKNNSKGTSE